MCEGDGKVPILADTVVSDRMIVRLDDLGVVGKNPNLADTVVDNGMIVLLDVLGAVGKDPNLADIVVDDGMVGPRGRLERLGGSHLDEGGGGHHCDVAAFVKHRDVGDDLRCPPDVIVKSLAPEMKTNGVEIITDNNFEFNHCQHGRC